MSDISSSPMTGASPKQDLAYYKAQYEQLELELQEFQASSRELEAELEKDIEASEKRERQLREKVESVGYEVDEWKTKYKQSKAEASNAQSTLQKEITTLRDANRTLQLKLRDIEVANDDYERQARNTTSSLENLESKFNQAIERAVMLEEEIKIGEQEREGLRIETQRLRDELSDLKIEAEIVQEKLRNAETTIEAQRNMKLHHHLGMDHLRAPSPGSEASTSATTLSSPTASTPPPKSSVPSIVSDTQTPPSPPLSETSARPRNVQATPTPVKRRPPTTAKDKLTTPRPGQSTVRGARHSRGPSVPQSQTGATRTTASATARSRQSTTTGRPSLSSTTNQVPAAARSGSLYHIRGLTQKIQKLEERVHNARSKLPAPIHTPPRASPRGGSAMSHHIPNTVTVRSNKKRSSGSTASSITGPNELRQSVSRLSFGVAAQDRVPSGTGLPSVQGNSRPSSRASVSSFSASSNTLPRPPSRSSLSGARTPLGYSTSTAKLSYAEGIRRPRSSMSGTWGHSSYGHNHSVSVSNIFETEPSTPGSTTPSVRRSITLRDVSGIPTPSMLPRRQSGGISTAARRQSVGFTGANDAPLLGDMGPPTERRLTRKLSEVGEMR